MLEKASLNFDAKTDDTKYLINYSLKGASKSNRPNNWNETLQKVHKELGWNPENESFPNLQHKYRISLYKILF